MFGEEAREHGLKYSLLERLYDLYRSYGGHAQDYIVQLSVNYRCHQDIMKIPNKLFYDNKVNPQPPGVQGQHPDAQAHPDISYPLVFLCTSMGSESYADTEANELLKYLHNVVITKWPDQWGVKNLKEVSIIAASRTQVCLSQVCYLTNKMLGEFAESMPCTTDTKLAVSNVLNDWEFF